MENLDTTQSLKKRERLYLRKEISQLFSNNTSFVCYPLRILYKVEETTERTFKYPSILVSVPKRNFKRANKRNYIKRLIRESYRINKTNLIQFANMYHLSLHIAFLYIGKEKPNLVQIESVMRKSITTIITQYEESKKNID